MYVTSLFRLSYLYFHNHYYEIVDFDVIRILHPCDINTTKHRTMYSVEITITFDQG